MRTIAPYIEHNTKLTRSRDKTQQIDRSGFKFDKSECRRGGKKGEYRKEKHLDKGEKSTACTTEHRHRDS